MGAYQFQRIPLPALSPSAPRSLAFDEGTHTLWSVNNPPSATGKFVWHFDLHGNLLSSWPAAPQSQNLDGIAVDTAGQRVFYFQNLGRYVQEARMDGTWVSTTQLPVGYQNNTYSLDYDPVTGQIVMPYTGTSAGPRGFLHMSPDTHSILFTEPYDLSGVSSLIYDFYLSQDAYWLLGASGSISTLVHVDRSSLRIEETFDIPGISPSNAVGLSRDSETGLFYVLNRSGMIEVFQVPEPSGYSLLVMGVIVLTCSRARPSKASSMSGSSERSNAAFGCFSDEDGT